MHRLLSFLLLGLALAACDTTGPGSSGVTGVTIDAPTTDVALDATLQLTATVQPSTESQSVRWTSDDETIATVSASGLVTGVAAGTARITATSTEASTQSASVMITVSNCPLPREVPSTISADVTWENWLADPECVDYSVGRLSVSAAVITIEPGVRVAFEADRSLVIRGDDTGLRAVGTAQDPIILTGLEDTRGSWGSLWLDGSAHPENRLEHVLIEYGGGARFSGSIFPGALLMTGGTETTLRSVTVRESSVYGLSMMNSAALRDHGSNVFTQNASGPAHVYASQVHFLDASSTGDDNDRDIVDVYANDITAAVTWVPFGSGYKITQQANRYAFDVRGADAFLTLEPGVSIFFEDDMAMTVADGAGISAVGTDEARIRLTTRQEIAAEANEGDGRWRGFRTFSDNPNQVFEKVFILRAGGDSHSGSVQPANVWVGPGATLRMSSSAIWSSAGYGLVAEAGASLPEFNWNGINAGNRLGPVHVTADVAADLTNTNAFSSTTNPNPSGDYPSAIAVNAYTHPITTATTWEDLGVPYVILDTPTGLVVENAAFTIELGTEILFQGDIGLAVDRGSLTVNGTEFRPVRFAGEGGSWKGIELLRSTASFSHTQIDGAGSSSWGSVQPSGAITINTASGAQSLASFLEGTSHSNTVGDSYGIVFGAGATTANCGPMEPVYIPTGDAKSDHCK